MCGMLPLAFAFGAGSQMLQPLAIAVIGGLLISIVLSLIVTPALYYQLTARRESAKQRSQVQVAALGEHE
jgi:Cu/Ag efflux pump CusA